MDRLPKRECYVFARPAEIWDLVGWDRETKKYHLRNDAGESIDVFHSEFVPVSLANEDLVLASDDGRILPASEALGGDIAIAPRRPPDGPSLHAPGTTGEKPRTARRAKEHGTGATDEARAKVRELLSGAKTREEIAGVAADLLGISAGDLVAKYAHLDNGRFRMVLGNRMVGMLK